MSHSEKTFMTKCENVNSSPFNCNVLIKPSKGTSAALGGLLHPKLGFGIPTAAFGNVPSESWQLAHTSDLK